MIATAVGGGAGVAGSGDPLAGDRDPPRRQGCVEALPRHTGGDEAIQHRHHCLALNVGTGVGFDAHVGIPFSVTISQTRSLTLRTDKIGRLAAEPRDDHRNRESASPAGIAVIGPRPHMPDVAIPSGHTRSREVGTTSRGSAAAGTEARSLWPHWWDGRNRGCRLSRSIGHDS